jgi:hypothetical protein
MRYNELSDEAKRKAVKWMQESNGELFDGDFVIEEWKLLLGRLGFVDTDIRWSGFCSQGDGACFTGHWNALWLDMLDSAADYTSAERAKEITAYPEKIRGLFKLLDTVADDEEQDSPIVTKCTLGHRGNYSHENSIDYTFDTGGAYPTQEAEEEFKEWCRDLMDMIYKDLEAEYEWVTGEEYAVEAIDINDYNFNEEGEAT